MVKSEPETPSLRAQRRTALLDVMADYVLAHGLAGSPLRALAAAAGTSDRMLLYYFEDRDDLVAATLAHVAARLIGQLALDEIPLSPDAMLRRLWSACRTPLLRPTMLLFVECASLAGRGIEPYGQAAQAIAAGFVDWLAPRLDAPIESRRAKAGLVMATLDGLFLLDCAGLAYAAEQAVSVSVFASSQPLSS